MKSTNYNVTSKCKGLLWIDFKWVEYKYNHWMHATYDRDAGNYLQPHIHISKPAKFQYQQKYRKGNNSKFNVAS